MQIQDCVAIESDLSRRANQKFNLTADGYIPTETYYGGQDVLRVPMLPKLTRSVRAHRVAERFHLLGERSDVAELLPAFDVFAMASLYEGLPCSVVEAMSCGIPVVATAVNAVPEVVVPGRTGLLVPPGRPDQLGRAIQHLLDHPELGSRMSAAASGNLGDRFRLEVLGTDLTETYLSALDGRVLQIAPAQFARMA